MKEALTFVGAFLFRRFREIQNNISRKTVKTIGLFFFLLSTIYIVILLPFFCRCFITKEHDYSFEKSIYKVEDMKMSKRGSLDIKTIGNIDYYSTLAIYAVYAVEILAIIFLAFTGAGTGLIEVLGLIHFVVVLADSIFQVFWRKESILLILVAIFLGGLYPIGRSWILDGSPDKISILFTLGYIGSLLFLFASMM